ncbi:hypothetical protein ACQ4M3_07850 [Leptolyngbya sp. AN03gr2]|uniref:hypothetical protein n=1 Tax=unclassified Leptolyngbya TaxID=2650499 RepID=UPI003D318DDD
MPDFKPGDFVRQPQTQLLGIVINDGEKSQVQVIRQANGQMNENSQPIESIAQTNLEQLTQENVVQASNSTQIFLVEQRYGIRTIEKLVEVCDWLNAFSTLDQAILFCQSWDLAEIDEDLPEFWGFAIVRATVDPDIPSLGNRILMRLNQQGKFLAQAQDR